MANDPHGNFIPRPPRFAVTDASDVRVTVTRTEAGGDETFDATLVDVSQHGTKLRVPMHFRFEETLQLRIEIENSDLEYHGVASVRHIRAADPTRKQTDEHETWVVGCAIAPPLSDETFAFLATTAGKERRRFRRLPIAAKATVRRQTQTTGTDATLHNLSSGGFCFSSDVEYDVGESVRLSLIGNDGEQRVISARICWQVDSPEGNIAGCQFTSSSSYAELCACLTEQPIVEAPHHVATQSTSKLVLTAAVLAMFVPPMLTLALQANKVSAEANPVSVATTDEVVAVPVIVVPELREWLDNTGQHRTQAKFVRATDEYVVLEKSNGKHAQVPWRRLSAADQEYAKEFQTSPTR